MATIRTLVKQLKAVKKALAKDRDRLRQIVEEAEELLEGKEDALDDLQRVIDYLSQYV